MFSGFGASRIADEIAERYGIVVATNTITKWLCETVYVGVFHMNKKGSVLGVGHGQKTKSFFRDKSEWISVERPDLRIVAQDIFELAQEIRQNRLIEGVKNKKGFY